jgi:hypothetical protein
MPCKETVAVCSENNENHRNKCTLCGQKKFNFYARSQNCEKRLLNLSCQSVRQHETTRLPQGEIFMKIDLRIFRKYAEKIKVSLKSDKNNRHFSLKSMHICDNISLNSSWNWNSFRQKL